ncbi:UbiA prenyltransferase family domain containing protein [Rhypophila decipiens]
MGMSSHTEFSSRYQDQPFRAVSLLWSFIESDFFTFAVPGTAFGLFGAQASSLLCDHDEPPISPLQILRRMPLILAFNVGNLLIVDLANQRTDRSVAEDKVNKPWRPIPQGKITIEQARRLLLAAIPVILALDYVLGVGKHGLMIAVLCWMYNDLGGSDEALVREMCNAVAYGLFNSGSLAVAVGRPGLSRLGLSWTLIISGVILTTMQVQDLKDQAGDQLRGRKTICLWVVAEHLLPYQDYSSESRPNRGPDTMNTSQETIPEKLTSQPTDVTAYAPGPSTPLEASEHPIRSAQRFYFSAIFLVFVPATIAAYFWLTWMYLVYPDRDDPAKFNRWDGSLVFYSWFLIGVFGLDWSRYGLVRAEAAMLRSSYWKASNTEDLLLHGDKSWSSPGGWLRYVKLLFSRSRKRGGEKGSRARVHDKLSLLLALLSILAFVALPLSGLSLETSDGFLYSKDAPMMICRTRELFNERQPGSSTGYYDGPTSAWEIGARPELPGLGILYTPEYLARKDFEESFAEVPNKFPLAGEGTARLRSSDLGTWRPFSSKCCSPPAFQKACPRRAFRLVARQTSPGSLYDSQDEGIFYHAPKTGLSFNVWGYGELGVQRVQQQFGNGLYNGSEPSSFAPDDIARPEGADFFEYVLWQVQLKTSYANELPAGVSFNTTMGTEGIRGLGHPVIQNSNGTFSLNQTFFQLRASRTNKTLTTYVGENDSHILGVPLNIAVSLAPPIGFRCRSVSVLGEASVNPRKSTFTSFEKSPPPPPNNEGRTLRFGNIAWTTLLKGGYYGLFTSTNSPPRLAVSNSYFYRSFVTPDMMQRSILQAYAMDALELMYDSNYGFRQAWENSNVTSARKGKVLTVGPVPPVFPAALFMAWAVGCVVLGVYYGFRKRSTDAMDGYSFVRIGVEVADRVRDDRDFWVAGRFQDSSSKTLRNLPGRIGDFRGQGR